MSHRFMYCPTVQQQRHSRVCIDRENCAWLEWSDDGRPVCGRARMDKEKEEKRKQEKREE